MTDVNELTYTPRPPKVLGHVNLMLDTFIANSQIDDLRAIVRNLLATAPPSTTGAFHRVARARLAHVKPQANIPHPSTFFTPSKFGEPTPTPQLFDALARARTLFGTGMGVESLGVLACIVRATSGFRWEEDGPMMDALAVVDADISQAIQSSKEQVAGELYKDLGGARRAINDLRDAMLDLEAEVAEWNGEFPFMRGLANAECWRL